jgi:DNA invertase Pin-like site-specific DNA recombinase
VSFSALAKGEKVRVIGYARLSKAEGGHGLDTQRAAIEAFCRSRGHVLVRIEEDDGASGRSTRKRPGLARALEACQSKEAEAILATRVDRLARSSLDFHRIIEGVTRAKATVLFTEQESFSLDTPEGRMLVGILASFAQFEADLISARTKAALRFVKENGSRSGRPIGNPSFHGVGDDLACRITALRADGLTYSAIAKRLTEDGTPTVQGGKKWHPATVRNVVMRSLVA